MKIFKERLLRQTALCAVPARLWMAVSMVFITACTPRVEVAPSDKPITINLNIKIEHEVKVKIDKQLEDEVFSKDSKLF